MKKQQKIYKQIIKSKGCYLYGIECERCPLFDFCETEIFPADKPPSGKDVDMLLIKECQRRLKIFKLREILK